LALGLLPSSASLATSSAASALLIEGVLHGKALRIVADAATSKAEVTLDGERHQVDLAAGEARLVQADGAMRKEELAAEASGPSPEIQPWGPGPTIAGHPSVYHVMSVNGEVCGELLVSAWMKPFVDPAVQALAILERVKGRSDVVKPAGLKGACGAVPFSSYALAGWPLMAGGIDRPIFKTEAISFDYRPGVGELAWSE
jgi:hypothetical protein